MTFKVGDRVVFGVDKTHYPLWNGTMFNAREKCPILIEGRVSEVKPDGRYVTDHRVGQADLRWSWPALKTTASTAYSPGFGVGFAADEALRLWWPRLAGTDSKIVPAAPEPTPVWQEAVSLGRRNDLPDPVLAQMIDRGERGVRRTLRFWPENRRLIHRQERVKGDIEDSIIIRWFWETIEAE